MIVVLSLAAVRRQRAWRRLQRDSSGSRSRRRRSATSSRTCTARTPQPWNEIIWTHGASDLYVQQNTWQPGGSTGWHTHPGPSFVIVTQGSVTVYEGSDKTCTPHVYTAEHGQQLVRRRRRWGRAPGPQRDERCRTDHGRPARPGRRHATRGRRPIQATAPSDRRPMPSSSGGETTLARRGRLAAHRQRWSSLRPRGSVRGRVPMKTWPSALKLLSLFLVASLAGACSATSRSDPPSVPAGRRDARRNGPQPSFPRHPGAGLGDLGWLDAPPTPGDAAAHRRREARGGPDEAAPGRSTTVSGSELDLAQPVTQRIRPTAQAQEFVRDRVDLIVAFEDKSIAAAQDATADPANRIPVVFLHPSDPVRDGLVDSLVHPGGNLTGVWGARDPVVKQLEIYRQILPDLQPLRLLTLVDPTDTARRRRSCRGARRRQPSSGSAGRTQGIRRPPVSRPPSTSLAPGAVDGVFILSPSLRLNFSSKILGLAAAANLPVQAQSQGVGRPATESTTARSSRSASTWRPSGTAAAPLRRQHPEGRQARRPASPGGAEGRVRP